MFGFNNHKIFNYLKILLVAIIPMYGVWAIVTVNRIPNHNKFSIAIYDRNGKSIGNIHKRNCHYLNYEQIPFSLQKKICIIEDVGFFSNSGISITSIIRSIIMLPFYVLQGNRPSGGSTITQQLMRSWYLSSSLSLIRKFNEIILALLFTLFHSKSKIFEYYFNNAYFGYNIYGFAKAATFYFNKSIYKLNNNEIAILVAMLKSSYYYSPFLYEKNLKDRKRYVLYRWLQYNIINQREYNIYSVTMPFIHKTIDKINHCKRNYFHLHSDILNYVDSTQYDLRNIKNIYLTIDDKLQTISANILKKWCEKWAKKSSWQGPIGKATHYSSLKYISSVNIDSKIEKVIIEDEYGNYRNIYGKWGVLSEKSKILYRQYRKILPGDVVLINKYNGDLYNVPAITGQITIISAKKESMGEVLVSLGTHNWLENKVNLSKKIHAPASCMKMFMLASIIENKIANLNSIVPDEPGIVINNKFYYTSRELYRQLNQRSSGSIWVTRNWDCRFRGNITLLDAFSQSRNIPFVHLGLNYLGLRKVNQILNNLGIIKKYSKYPALVLGSAWDISMEEFAVKSCIFVNNGIPVEKKLVNTVMLKNQKKYNIPHKKHNKVFFSPETIYQVLFAMRHSATEGLPSILNRLPYENVYIKTGTTAKTRNLQCIIFTKEYVIMSSICNRFNKSLIKNLNQTAFLSMMIDLINSIKIQDEKIMSLPSGLRKIHITKPIEGDFGFIKVKGVEPVDNSSKRNNFTATEKIITRKELRKIMNRLNNM